MPRETIPSVFIQQPEQQTEAPTQPTKEPLKRKLYKAAGRAVGEIVLDMIPKQVAYAENLDKFREHLQGGGKGVVIANHFGTLDFSVWFDLTRRTSESKKLRHRGKLTHTGALGAEKRLDQKRGPGAKIQSGLADFWTGGSGITLIPMVQSGDIGAYTDWRRRMKRGKDAAEAFINQDGNALLITLEGTKIRTGVLGKGQTGVDHMLKDLADQDVKVLPMAAIPRTILPGSDVLVVIGEPVSYQQLLDEQKATGLTITELLMLKLADLLPEENQGEIYMKMFADHPELRHHPELAHIELNTVSLLPYKDIQKLMRWLKAKISKPTENQEEQNPEA